MNKSVQAFHLNSEHHTSMGQQRKEAKLSLTNIENVQYLGEMFFGNPPQKMRIQFDTGSEAVYILEAKCSNYQCGKQPKFKGYKSHGYHEFIEGVFVDAYSKN